MEDVFTNSVPVSGRLLHSQLPALEFCGVPRVQFRKLVFLCSTVKSPVVTLYTTRFNTPELCSACGMYDIFHKI